MQLLYAKIKELVCAQATNTNKSGKDCFSTVAPAPCSDVVNFFIDFFFCTHVCCFSHVLSVALNRRKKEEKSSAGYLYPKMTKLYE